MYIFIFTNKYVWAEYTMSLLSFQDNESFKGNFNNFPLFNFLYQLSNSLIFWSINHKINQAFRKQTFAISMYRNFWKVYKNIISTLFDGKLKISQSHIKNCIIYEDLKMIVIWHEKISFANYSQITLFIINKDRKSTHKIPSTHKKV